jgi:hypothetical protein
MDELVEFAEKVFEARLEGIREETARNGNEFSCRDQLEEALSCVRGLKATVRIREMRSGSAARR